VKRIATIVLAVTVATGAATGFAASLNVSSDHLGSGIAPVTSCDTDGVNASYTIVLGLVTAVVVSGIADGSASIGAGACDGEMVYVEALSSGGSVILGATGARSNTGDSNTTNDTVSVPLAVPPPAANVANVRITITG
jgi:hypothetical protein